MKKISLIVAIVLCCALCGAIVFAASSPNSTSDSPFKNEAEKNYVPPKIGSTIIPIKVGSVTVDQETLVKQLNLSFPKNKASEIFNIIVSNGNDETKMNTALTNYDKNIKLDEIKSAISRASQQTVTKQARITSIEEARAAQVKRQDELNRLAAEKEASERRLQEEKDRLALIATQQKEKIAQINKEDEEFKKTLTKEEAVEYDSFKREMNNAAKMQAYKDWYEQQNGAAQVSSDHGQSSDHSQSGASRIASSITTVIKTISTPIITFFKNLFSWNF